MKARDSETTVEVNDGGETKAFKGDWQCEECKVEMKMGEVWR